LCVWADDEKIETAWTRRGIGGHLNSSFLTETDRLVCRVEHVPRIHCSMVHFHDFDLCD
jgi:hypothetical protein